MEPDPDGPEGARMARECIIRRGREPDPMHGEASPRTDHHKGHKEHKEKARPRSRTVRAKYVDGEMCDCPGFDPVAPGRPFGPAPVEASAVEPL